MIDQTTVKRLLDYDPISGLLYWKIRTIEDCATERAVKIFNIRLAGKEAFTATGVKGYKIGAIYNKCYLAHRIIWLWFYGLLPDQIDHENGVRSDNRIWNLFNVDNATNHLNLGIPKNNTSGCSGVDWCKRERRWRSRISHRGQVMTLGYFLDYNTAVQVRKNAEVDLGFHPNHADRVRYA